ncbi:hypothetical protein pb186bvf_009115 [Paramecium bursaria]
MEKIIENIDYDVGLQKTRQRGIKYGFENQYYRKIVWTKLLNLNQSEFIHISEHARQYDQLRKDVDRSFNTIIEVKNHKCIDQMRNVLMDILNTVFAQCPHYCYYQGYHDIVSIFILVLGYQDGYKASILAAQYFFRDYLEQDFERSLMPQMKIVSEILRSFARDQADQLLFKITNEIQQPMCLIPWILTWYSHSLESIDDICRIWDYLLCSNQQQILYLTAAFIIELKHLVIEQEDDLLIVFQEVFQDLNKRSKYIQIETILEQATLLSRKYPIEHMQVFQENQNLRQSLIDNDKFLNQIPYSQIVRQKEKRFLYNFFKNNKQQVINMIGIGIAYSLPHLLITD